MLPRIDRGVKTVVPAVVSNIKTFYSKAQPIIRESAAVWRHTVDNHIAPKVRDGLVAVGTVTVNGISAGVDTLAGAVMGEEKKDETFGALKVLANAAMGTASNDTTETNQEYYNYDDYYQYHGQYQVEDNVAAHAHQPRFQYQEITPGVYQSIEYPPPPSSQQSYPVDVLAAPVETLEAPVYPDMDPRHQYPHQYPYATNKLPVNRDSSIVSDYYWAPPPTGSSSPPQQMTVEEALYVLGKNLFGRNVTDRLFPVAKQVAEGFGQVGKGLETISDAIPLPSVEFDSSGIRVKTIGEDAGGEVIRGERNSDGVRNGNSGGRITANAPRCTTPKGGNGRCMDIQNCPLLLADLDMLRKSICFKSLFVPGVCCPDSG